MKWDKDIDKIFAEGFESFEPGMDDGDWQKMASLLDEEKKGFFLFWSNFKSKFNLKKIIIMTSILTIIGIGISLIISENSHNEVRNANKTEVGITEIEIQKIGGLIEKQAAELKRSRHDIAKIAELESISAKPDNTLKNKVIGNQKGPKIISIQHEKMNQKNFTIIKERIISNTTPVLLETVPEVSQDLKSKNFELQTKSLASSLRVPKDSIVYKSGSIVRYFRTLETEYEYFDCFIDQSKPIQDFWFGFYFTQQVPNIGTITNGFNIQSMSGNLIKHNRIGIYGGLDWGMQFYGRTPNMNVALNTSNGDSGYTRLRNNAMDFVLKSQLEYSTKYFAPYITAGAGPRLYYTGQKVKSYLPIKDVEPSDRNTLVARLSMIYTIGAGARIKLAPRVALDLRYELTKGQQTQVMDLNRTTFNGLKYNEVMKDYTPNYHSFRLGLTIDVSEENCKDREVKRTYWKSTVIDSTVVNNINDSSIIVLPCPKCPCRKTNNTNQQNELNDEREDKEENEPLGIRLIDILNSGSPGTNPTIKPPKKSFPGIKAPPSIRN
jgi:opacity protein-like surface antigen